MTENTPDWRRAEEAIAERKGLEHLANQRGVGFYDAYEYTGEGEGEGIKYQIKSADADSYTWTDEEGNKQEEEPRFRLWEDQHRSLTASEGQLGEAYYIFIVSNREAVEVLASEVTEWVNDRGGWNDASHDIRESRQLKIPTEYVYKQV
jgi:hypothetical protein